MKAQISAAEHDRRREQSKGDQKPRVYSIPFAGAMAGLNRNASYAAAKRGEIPTIKFGKLLKVPAAAWHRIVGE
jgi:hypothetical protein